MERGELGKGGGTLRRGEVIRTELEKKRPGDFSPGLFFWLREALNRHFQIRNGEYCGLPLRTSDARHASCRRARLASRSKRGLGHGPVCEARRFTDKLHAAANAELGKQGRDVEFYGTLGQIQIAGDFLVGKSTQYSTENFFFATSYLYFAFYGLPCFEELIGSFHKAEGMALFGFDHDDVVFGRLASDHAVHGKQASGLVKRQGAV